MIIPHSDKAGNERGFDFPLQLCFSTNIQKNVSRIFEIQFTVDIQNSPALFRKIIMIAGGTI